MKRIAIQGRIGSFHDIAAHQYFEGEQLQLVCCDTFEEVFDNVKRDPTMIAMTAIENTIAGSLLHNYELLRDSGLTVVGEHKLHISHCICCLPDDDWETIQEVHSHPVALMQCRNFLAGHPSIKAVESDDTAGSAQYISENSYKCSFPRIVNPDEGRLPQTSRKDQQVEPCLLAATRGRLSLAGAQHPHLLQDKPHKDTVAAHHRTRMGIPLLRGCHLRQSHSLPTKHRRHYPTY